MSVISKAALKNNFADGTIITEDKMDDLIDSTYNEGSTQKATLELSTAEILDLALPASGGTPASVGGTTQTFVYIENLGLLADGTTASTSDVLKSLNGNTSTDYRNKIGPGEAFCARLGASNGGDNNVYMKTEDADAAVQTVQIFRGWGT